MAKNRTAGGIGGSLSGLSAAYLLRDAAAKEGIRITDLENNRYPGSRRISWTPSRQDMALTWKRHRGFASYVSHIETCPLILTS